jgi:excisionase family DNA binding protein
MKNNSTIGVREAARRLGVTLKYIYDLLYTGRLPGRKIGRVWHIPVESVQARLLTKEGRGGTPGR